MPFDTGAAMSMFFIPLITLSLSGLAPERIPAASGLFNFARLTAGSFGTSIATTLWDRRATLHHAQLVEHLTAFDAQSERALALLQANGAAWSGWRSRRRKGIRTCRPPARPTDLPQANR